MILEYLEFSQAAEKACEELVARMSQFVNVDDAWADKVRKAASNEVDLTARYSSRPIADGAQLYYVYGATLCEVRDSSVKLWPIKWKISFKRADLIQTWQKRISDVLHCI